MTKGDPGILLKAREHLTIVHHVPGKIRLRFGLGIMGAVPELADKSEREALSSWPGIEDIAVSPLTFSLTIRYAPDLLPPDDWPTLIEGEEKAAQAVIERLRALRN